MKPSGRIKPISYLKAHTSEKDIDSYEQTQETMALLKALALGNPQIEAGKVKPAADVFARLRARHRAR